MKKLPLLLLCLVATVALRPSALAQYVVIDNAGTHSFPSQQAYLLSTNANGFYLRVDPATGSLSGTNPVAPGNGFTLGPTNLNLTGNLNVGVNQTNAGNMVNTGTNWAAKMRLGGAGETADALNVTGSIRSSSSFVGTIGNFSSYAIIGSSVLRNSGSTLDVRGITDTAGDGSIAASNIVLRGTITATNGFISPSSTVTLTADDQVIGATTNAMLVISSDNATAANRTFKLTTGIDGKTITLIWSGTNQGELVDDSANSGSGNVRLNGNWPPVGSEQYSALELRGYGNDWREVARTPVTVGAGSQTPWVSDINADSYSLTNAKYVHAKTNYTGVLSVTNEAAFAQGKAGVTAAGRFYSNPGGGADNFVAGSNTSTNSTSADYGVLAGGLNNYLSLQCDQDVVLGGQSNGMGLGVNNYAEGCGIIAGAQNAIWHPLGTAYYSVILGGNYNRIHASSSLAAGTRSVVSNAQCFVWSDDVGGTNFYTTSSNQFLIKATGGVGINTNNPAGHMLAVLGDAAVYGSLYVGNGVKTDMTITPGGTTGNQTINKTAGTVNFAAAATSITVTCDKCTTSSLIFAQLRTNDSTARIANVVPGSGSFTINLTAAATAETSCGFMILNP